MGTFNQSFSYLKILVSFLVFLLGTKFTPHKKYPTKDKLHREAFETLRKVFWTNYFLSQPKTNSVGIPLNFFVRKSTDVPSQHRPRLIEESRKIAQQAQKQIQTSWSKISKHYLDQRFWSQILPKMSDLRFVLCDKNLGGELLDKVEYFALNTREMANYELVCKITASERPIEAVLRRLFSELLSLLTAFDQYLKFFDLMMKPFTDIRSIIDYCSKRPLSSCNLPQLKLLIKKHKAKKEGLWQTRPIIPNCGLPIYPFSKFLGSFLARLQKKIPWVLEDSRNFREWLSLSSRGSVSTFDFSNLYGTERVKDTLLLFEGAIQTFRARGIFRFENEHDEVVLEGLLNPMEIPSDLYEHNFGDVKLSALTVMTYMCTKSTIAVCETSQDQFSIVKTTEFLAMGSSPVAPLSNITLAYLEYEKFGFEKCAKGMRRLIDDIAIDENVISRDSILSAYPPYLTLNDAGSEHFLDVSFLKTQSGYLTWPYVKPFAIIPLNIASFHTQHTKIAAAKGELVRLLNLCSDKRMWGPWIELWKLRYRAAGYAVDDLEKSVFKRFNRIHTKPAKTRNNTLFHVETWNGCNTFSAMKLREIMKTHFTDVTFETSMTSWAQNATLSGMLLKANPTPKQLPFDRKNFSQVLFIPNKPPQV